jgi:hypothetical protein
MAYPDFPLRECWQGPRVRLSIKLTTGFTGPLFPSHQLSLGAPRSHQRTWFDKDGAKPPQSSDNLSPKQNLGGPYLARFWRDVGFHRSIPEHLPAKCAYPLVPASASWAKKPKALRSIVAAPTTPGTVNTVGSAGWPACRKTLGRGPGIERQSSGLNGSSNTHAIVLPP